MQWDDNDGIFSSSHRDSRCAIFVWRLCQLLSVVFCLSADQASHRQIYHLQALHFSVVRMHLQSHYVRLPLKRFNTPHVTITRRIPPALSCAEREHGSRNHQVTSAAQIHFHGMHWHREAVLNNIECSTYLAMRWALIFPKARLPPIRILHVRKNPPK